MARLCSTISWKVGPPSAVTFNHGFSLTRGDIIDFAVGFGRNGTYANDSTALAATIQPGSPSSPTPEPRYTAAFHDRSAGAI